MTGKSTDNDDITSKLSISVNEQTVAILPDQKNILESLEYAGVETHSHCRDGFCGVCRVTLCHGEIYYPNGEPLAYVGDNEILPCCCVAKTSIVIEID